ncbi:MAG: fused MFS/spermidine synthase [Anaerolineae bacterium]
MSDRILALVVFFSGMTSLGLELAASRLFAPYFGVSLIIWANLIGLILIYLTLGYYLGGRWADRDPRLQTLYHIVGWGGFTSGVLPFVAKPLLDLAIPALQNFDAGLGATSFFGTLILFAAPVTLLGCVTPFALRLRTHDLNAVGATAGKLYALSTLGSILGVYLTTFVLIPNLGTRRTFALLALILLALAAFALWQRVGLLRALPYAGLALIIVLLATIGESSIVKATPGLVIEAESPYNFIQVIRDGDGLYLTVNEGQAYQSVYYPNTILLNGYWDLMLIAPSLRSNEPPQSLLVIGLAAGTIPKQYSLVYPNIKMDGVEIDPQIIALGKKYFEMNEPNLRAIVDDGRAFLRRREAGIYDVIAVDAYHQPYIPFHLATVEFFQELEPHLSPRGVIAINAAGLPNDKRLANAIAATLHQVYPTVVMIDHPNGANTVILASPEHVDLDSFRARLADLHDPTLRYAAGIAAAHLYLPPADQPVFTDDRAPVEDLVHSIIIDAALGGKP